MDHGINLRDGERLFLVRSQFAEPRSLVRTTDCKHSSGGSCPKFSKKFDAHSDFWTFCPCY